MGLGCVDQNNVKDTLTRSNGLAAGQVKGLWARRIGADLSKDK
jgi:hypothetical protein